MVIHITPIGEQTEHVMEWIHDPVMTNLGAITKIYLIHSKKTPETDFPKKARELEKKIKEAYAGVEVIKKPIGNAFNLDDTMDAITEIVYEVREAGVENYEIAINVTGGTNVMAAAAILAATMRGTKAYYVLHREKNPILQKSYVVELPIPPIGIAKMNKTQQKVLALISQGTFVHIMKENGKVIGNKYEDSETGAITNQEILEKMKLNTLKNQKYTDRTKTEILNFEHKKGIRKRQEGATKIAAVVKGLARKGYITILKETPTLDKISLGGGRYDYKKGTISRVMCKITPAGYRQAKDTMMFKE